LQLPPHIYRSHLSALACRWDVHWSLLIQYNAWYRYNILYYQFCDCLKFNRLIRSYDPYPWYKLWSHVCILTVGLPVSMVKIKSRIKATMNQQTFYILKEALRAGISTQYIVLVASIIISCVILKNFNLAKLHRNWWHDIKYAIIIYTYKLYHTTKGISYTRWRGEDEGECK